VLCGVGVYVLLATLMVFGDKPAAEEEEKKAEKDQATLDSESNLLRPGKLR